MMQHRDERPARAEPAAWLHPAKPGQTAGLESFPVVEAENLFAGTREIGIRHGGALYRLKITRQGKLILNK